MRQAIIVVFLAFLSGCTSNINYNVKPVTESFTEPAVNEVVEAYVGDYIIKQGRTVTMEYLIVSDLIDRISFDIPPGEYARIGEYKGVPYYAATSTKGLSVTSSPNFSSNPIVALHYKNESELCVTIVNFRSAACYEVQVKIEERTVLDSQAIQQVMVYNGAVGEKINIAYREFSNETATKGFTNNIEYDMSNSNEINYKGSRIEVISFDNTSIKFKVARHFRNVTDSVYVKY